MVFYVQNCLSTSQCNLRLLSSQRGKGGRRALLDSFRSPPQVPNLTGSLDLLWEDLYSEIDLNSLQTDKGKEDRRWGRWGGIHRSSGLEGASEIGRAPSP